MFVCTSSLVRALTRRSALAHSSCCIEKRSNVLNRGLILAHDPTLGHPFNNSSQRNPQLISYLNKWIYTMEIGEFEKEYKVLTQDLRPIAGAALDRSQPTNKGGPQPSQVQCADRWATRQFLHDDLRILACLSSCAPRCCLLLLVVAC